MKKLSTTTTLVSLEWINACKWFLLQTKDGEIAYQEIPEDTKEPMKFLSCFGVLWKFLGRSKTIPQLYKVTIEHLGDAPYISKAEE